MPRHIFDSFSFDGKLNLKNFLLRMNKEIFRFFTCSDFGVQGFDSMFSRNWKLKLKGGQLP